MSSQAFIRRTDDGRGRMALILVIAAESVFFVTLTLSYMYLRSTQATWPFSQLSLPELVLPVANTFLLIFSGVTVWMSERGIRLGNDGRLKAGLVVTVVLGLAFIAGQVLEFTRAGMHPADQAFGGVFFALMGFHALHLLAGMVVLVICLIRAMLGDFTSARHQSVSLGAWFWYFVVAVWLILFTALFLV